MTLVEVAIATALFTVASVSAAHLFVWTTRTLWASGAETIAVAAAQAKMEELQSLTWRFDESGNRISDFESNLSVYPFAGGGPGLAWSPANALRDNLAGYVDYLDEHGESVGTGSQPPDRAAFVRRWAVRPMASSPEDTLVLQVLVIPLASNAGRTALSPGSRTAGASLLSTARTRLR
jgi:hypothetical protein